MARKVLIVNLIMQMDTTVIQIKRHFKKLKRFSSLDLLAFGFVIGLIAMYLFLQPKLKYHGKNASDWANVANENQTIVNQKQKEVASYKSQLKLLQTAPTPTPEIIYKTQYVQPSQQSLPQPQEKCTAYNGTTCVAWQLPPGSF